LICSKQIFGRNRSFFPEVIRPTLDKEDGADYNRQTQQHGAKTNCNWAFHLLSDQFSMSLTIDFLSIFRPNPNKTISWILLLLFLLFEEISQRSEFFFSYLKKLPDELGRKSGSE
jgi:hypothetical protein